jgi:hypothetical protein
MFSFQITRKYKAQWIIEGCIEADTYSTTVSQGIYDTVGGTCACKITPKPPTQKINQFSDTKCPGKLFKTETLRSQDLAGAAEDNSKIGLKKREYPS